LRNIIQKDTLDNWDTAITYMRSVLFDYMATLGVNITNQTDIPPPPPAPAGIIEVTSKSLLYGKTSPGQATEQQQMNNIQPIIESNNDQNVRTANINPQTDQEFQDWYNAM